MFPEPRENIRPVSHRSTRRALAAWNMVSVTQPRLSLHSFVYIHGLMPTMDPSLHSNIDLDGSFSFWLEHEYAFPFMALYKTTQQTGLSPQSFVYTAGSNLSDLSPQSLSQTEEPVSLYTECTVHWWPRTCDKPFPRSLMHT